jgi:hypothetical protein
VIIVLIPIAIEMIAESISGRNTFSYFGGVPEQCEIRDGKIRAQGPFAHSILAGTVGALSWPLALMSWKRNRKLAIFGLLTSAAIVFASKSSGPIMTTLIALGGILLWRFRTYLRIIRWGGVLTIFLLALVMKAPVYYLIARIDLTGSSTGWHRAALIEAAITHLDEWWLAGTDYTRHWMPTGVAWSANHTDITNHYLKMGVIGGLPLMLSFIAILCIAFKFVGKTLVPYSGASDAARFRMWLFGSILFAHSVTWLSVSYFDQSIIFVYFVLAAIASSRFATETVQTHAAQPERAFISVETPNHFITYG